MLLLCATRNSTARGRIRKYKTEIAIMASTTPKIIKVANIFFSFLYKLGEINLYAQNSKIGNETMNAVLQASDKSV